MQKYANLLEFQKFFITFALQDETDNRYTRTTTAANGHTRPCACLLRSQWPDLFSFQRHASWSRSPRRIYSLVCNMTEAGPTTARSCFPAADIASSVDIAFENRTYKTMVGYKNYLSHTYGDYMQLPPEDQRVTHHFEAYWR